MSNNAEIISALRSAGIAVQAPANEARQGVIVEVPRTPRALRLYSWEVRDNGLATGVERPADERRIQAIASNTQRIDVEEPEGLVLGWSDEFTSEPIIVAFNPYGVAQRTNGKVERKLRAGAQKARASDSQQFRQALLDEAITNEVAVAQNQHGEFVVAFKPARFVEYVAQFKPKYHSRSNAQIPVSPDDNRMEDLVLEAEQEMAGPIDGDDQAEPAFDPAGLDDGRERVAREIAVRRGQPAFRARLISNYGCCVVTGCRLSSVLEAAHIVPYSGPGSNHISNGLLLRADIHTLFDLGLLSIHEADFTVLVSERLFGTEYEVLKGQPIQMKYAPHQPSKEALAISRKRAVA